MTTTGPVAKRLRIRRAAVLVAILALGAAACSSSKSSSSTAGSVSTTAATGGGTASTTAAAGGGNWLDQAKQASQAATNTPSTIVVKSLGPVKVTKGLKIFFVGCDQSIPGCVSQVKGMKDAAAAAGANLTVCDAKTDVASFQNCMSQGVNAKPDAIVNNARLHTDAPDSYKAAHDAGIPIIGQFTSELPDPAANTAEVGYVCSHEGELLGDYIVASSNGKANVVMFADTVYACNGQRADGVKKALDTCPTCTLTIKRYNVGTAQTDLPPQLQAAIQSTSGLNWIVGTPGFAGNLAADAVRQAGKDTSISAGTFDAEDPELALIRKNDIMKADIVSGIYENGWTVMDTILRLKAGQAIPNNIENPSQLLYTHDNVPASGSYFGASDYQSQFKALWGVS